MMEFFKFENGRNYSNEKYIVKGVSRVGNKLYDENMNRYQIKSKLKVIEIVEEYIEIAGTKIYAFRK